MRHYSSFSVVFFVALATVFLAGQVTANVLCNDASYKPLCNSLVTRISDPAAATQVIVNALIGKTQIAKAMAMKLGKKNQMAETCIENYDLAIGSLKKSLRSIKARDKATVLTMISASISGYSTCEDAYAEFGVVKSPLIGTNRALERIASCGLSVYGHAR